MSKWKIGLSVAVVFISGFIIGAVAAICSIHSHISSMVEEGPAAFNRMIAHHLVRELDLTEEQETAVLIAVTRTHEDLWQFKLQHEDKIAAIIQEGIDQIKTDLNPKQQEKLDVLHKHIHANLDSHLSPHPEEEEPPR